MRQPNIWEAQNMAEQYHALQMAKIEQIRRKGHMAIHSQPVRRMACRVVKIGED